MMRAALLLSLALLACRVGAEDVPICFNYACAKVAVVRYEEAELEPVGRMLAGASDAAAERSALAEAVARMYAIAASRTPIFRDRGENFDDDEVNDGRMDCIDHSTNTSSFLHLIEERGWLRHHGVMQRLRRFLFLQEHWAGRIAERASGQQFTVDTWYFPPGQPAVVQPVAEWLQGRRPAPR